MSSQNNTKVAFVEDENTNTALLGSGGNEGTSINSRTEAREDDLYDTASKPTSAQSSVTTRQRTRSTIAKERDQMMIEEEAQAGFCKRYKRFMVLVPYIMLQGISAMFVRPLLPDIYKDYFGSDKKAGEITSYVAAVTALIGMFTCAFYGKLLDTVGRKPFFVLAPLFQLAIPNLLLVIFRETPIIYMLAGALGNLIQGSYTSSYLADCFSTKTRVKVFSAQVAVGNLMAFFALFVGFFDDTILITLACIFSFLAVAYAFFFIKESIPEDVRQPFSKDLCMGNPFSAMKFLFDSKLCRAVIAIVACFLFAQVGTGDIYMFFLNDRVGFNKTDNAIVFAEDGLLTPLVLLFLLPYLSKRLAPSMVIFISLIALMIELIVIATIWAKWPIFAFVVPLVSLTMMMIPILLAVLSNAGNPADQGRRLSGFQALADLCDAFGPLVFGGVYGNVGGALSFLPFAIAAVFVIPAGYVAFLLPKYIKEDNDEREAKAAEAVSRGRSASTVNSLIKHDRVEAV